MEQYKDWGFSAVVSSYAKAKKLISQFDEDYAKLPQSSWGADGTIDEWVVGSII